MSCFVQFLRWIVFCGEEEDELHRYSYRTRENYAPLPTKITDSSYAQRPKPLLDSTNPSPSPPLPSKTSPPSIPPPKPSQSSSSSSLSSDAYLSRILALRAAAASSSSVALPPTPSRASLPSSNAATPPSPSLPSKTSQSSSSFSSDALSRTLALRAAAAASSSVALPPTPSPAPLPSSNACRRATPPSPSLPSKTSQSSSSLSSDALSRFSALKEAAAASVALRPRPSPAPVFSSKPCESEKSSPEILQIKRQDGLPKYEIPKDLQDMIKKDIVPAVLKRPLSPSTYADYFATLLYAEDYYLEKWSGFLLSGVTLQLRSRKYTRNSQESKKKKENDFVAFEIDSIPGKRPYLLSRDFVFVRQTGKNTESFKGILFRVEKSTEVLVEFGDDFHSQHSPSKKYDVSFSFNRVCLKRSHQAISAAKDPSLHNIIFPDPNYKSSSLSTQPNVIHHYKYSSLSVASRILNHKGPLPYLLEGPLAVVSERGPHSETETPPKPSATGRTIHEAIVKIYSAYPRCRILICAPTNRACDVLMQSLHKEIPRSNLFRANAAFRDYDLVPGDILPECLYKGECFTCPSLSELQNFKIVSSTFVSSFRLHVAGVDANHFTHIFLVDSSSATEPEAVVALANLVGKDTVVVVSGSLGNSPVWVRSDIARRYGLKKSYFQRLLEREPYVSRNPMFIAHVK